MRSHGDSFLMSTTKKGRRRSRSRAKIRKVKKAAWLVQQAHWEQMMAEADLKMSFRTLVDYLVSLDRGTWLCEFANAYILKDGFKLSPHGVGVK